MKLAELKQQIQQGAISNELKIFLCSENYFLADQYTNCISEKLILDRNYINNLSDLTQSALSLVFDYNQYLNVLKCDSFDELCEDYSQFTNTVIICNKIDKQILGHVQEYVIEIPKLLDWQIQAYIQTSCPGLDKYAAEKLYINANKDIYRIDNELEKLKLIPKQEQSLVLDELLYSKNTDLYYIEYFDLLNAIIEKNIPVLYNYLKYNKVEPESFRVIGGLIAKYKQILVVVFNGANPSSLGMTDKQTKYIKYKMSNHTEAEIKHNLTFLTGIDVQLKQGRLDLTSKQLFDYILCNLY